MSGIKEGDLRACCKECPSLEKGKCQGCFVGNGGVARIDGEDEWNELCSTICRDEDLAVKKLIKISEFYYQLVGD